MPKTTRRRRNPLSATAYKDESVPAALVRLGVPVPDDRSGVHVTSDFGLAVTYAAHKAAHSASIAVVLAYDLAGLKLVADHDAKVEADHDMLLGEVGYWVDEFDILLDPDNPDYDRLAALLEGEASESEVDGEGPPWSVTDELTRQARQPLAAVLADKLRGGGADADLVIEAMQAGSAAGLPREWFSEVISQWRTFSDIGNERLVLIVAVEPYYDRVDLATEPGGCPVRYGLEDLDGLGDQLDTEVLWRRRRPVAPRDIYYHGTDLTRARKILGASFDRHLVNPWAPVVQPLGEGD